MRVLGLHVGAALRAHSSVQSERFGQHGGALVNHRQADAAVEDRETGGETGNWGAIGDPSEVNGL